MPSPVTIHREDYAFKTQPYAHQREAFMLSRDILNFALLMGMGTGKSKVAIDTAAYNYDLNRIDCLIVIAPKGVHRNWIDKEVPVHMPDWTNYRAATWTAKMRVAQKKAVNHVLDPEHKGLRVIAMNIEGFTNSRTCKPAKFLRPILNALRCLVVIDESSKIKTPGAKRTAALRHLGNHATAKRILTGTPVTQGPLDIYSQFAFLDRDILGFDNFTTFKNYFAEWEQEINRERNIEINRQRYQRGQEADPDAGAYQVLRGYRNIETLKKLIQPHSYRITKEECTDIPPKVFVPRIVELSDEQRRVYNRVVKDSIIELDGRELTVNNVLTRLLRLQQVVGGFVPVEEFGDPEPIPGPNNRIESLLTMTEETAEKFIIWARFKAEIRAILSRLRETHGPASAVAYYGDVNDDDRAEAVNRFQGQRPIVENGVVKGHEEIVPTDQARFFVGQQQSGGYGLTLTAGTQVVYYSNTFSFEDRMQSEDRAHRIGQRNVVTYTDLEALGTIDRKIMRALKSKLDMADMVTEDSKRLSEGRSNLTDPEVVADLFATV
jgi:SNF2 family DNA or RNA helicase